MCKLEILQIRLGTAQKATDVLLEALAQIAAEASEWELHLIGGIEKGFEGFWEKFWERFPELKGHVRLLEHILDRDIFFEEYRMSQIFALPSTFEGGTSNVIAGAQLSCRRFWKSAVTAKRL